MKSIDYSWVIGIVVVVALALFWKPIVGSFQGLENKATNKDAVDRGKIVFYDTERWGGKDSYKSCAMCHAADFVPDPDKTITMGRYKAGEKVVLKGLAKKYPRGVMGDEGPLYDAVLSCLTAPDKIGSGTVMASAKFMQDLLAYLYKL